MKKFLGMIGIALLLSSCSDVYESVVAPALDLSLQQAGLSEQERQSIRRVGSSVAKSMEEITPEQEYYVGRTVAATILSTYRIYDNSEAQAYINRIGDLITYQSDRPNVFGGYHFMVLDSDEINAFAAPGGFIFVTRGMLRCTDSEDAVAAVLAHEIAHVTHKHGLRSIKKSRWTRVATLLGVEAAKNYSSQELATLVSTFEGSIDDIINTLVVNGYSRDYEIEADRTAVVLLGRVGYDPAALLDMLHLMEKQLKPGGMDFAKTHPAPSARIREINAMHISPTPIPDVRQQRYHEELAGI